MVNRSSIFERYRLDTEVTLGANCLKEVLSQWCSSMGLTGILVFGQGNSVSVEEQGKIVSNLQDRGLSVQTIKGACADSHIAHLQQISAYVDPTNACWIAAIGGGSVIDTGKLLALKALQGFAVHSIQSFEELQDKIDKFELLPLFAAPTCIGSGAEVNSLADILLNSRGVRVPITTPAMYPQMAVVDYAIASPPLGVQSSAIVDAVTHLIDPWLNSLPRPVPQEDTTVALLRALVRLTRIWVCDGFNPASFLKFATISHLAVRPGLARCSTAVSVLHRIEHVLSPRIGCHHGEGLAILLPAFLKWMEAERPNLLIEIADQFADIFERVALPSTLVSDWLCSLPLNRWTFNPTDLELKEITSLIIASFGNSHGLLPGGLSIGKAEVQAILSEAKESHLTGNSSGTIRTTHQAKINTNRLFGGTMPTNAFHVVMTPIRPIFEMLCHSLGATVREGWYSTAIVTSSEKAHTVLVCPPPGSNMAEDCLGFLLKMAGRLESLLFLGFAGSLTEDLRCGEVVAPTYVVAVPRVEQPRRLLEVPFASMHKELYKNRAWTVRSARLLTDESEDMLQAWRWAGVDLIDLETSGIATFCDAKGIPFSALLVVSDQPLNGVSLWSQPPFNSNAGLSHSIKQVVDQAHEHILNFKLV